MQDILNAFYITIAIAFLGLVVTDFVAGLTVLATATSIPSEPETPVLPPVDVPEVEEMLVPTPKTQALGQLLLEEYELENQQYWEQWHNTYQSVRANLPKILEIKEVTLAEELTTQNFSKIETVNETPEPQPALKQTKRAGRPKKEVQNSVKTAVQTVAPKRRRGRPRKAA